MNNTRQLLRYLLWAYGISWLIWSPLWLPAFGIQGLPAFLYRPTYSSMGPGEIAGFFASLFTGAIILTWLYNATRGSILMVALFHAIIELIFLSKPVTPQMSMYEGMLLTIWAVIIVVFTRRAKEGNLVDQMAQN